MPLSPDFRAFLDELCRNNDISSVATEHGISVKRSGNNYMCCCPFHAEKTPSCHLYIEDNHFHCYGCGAHGNVIKFVMQAENIDFMGAVEMLSNRVGMAVPRGGGGQKKKKGGYNYGSNYGSSYGSSNRSNYGSSSNRSNYGSSDYGKGNSRGGAVIAEKAESPSYNDGPQLSEPPPENNNYYQSDYDDGYSLKKRIYEMNQEAGKFFHEQLLSPEGKEGMEYFTRRGLSFETIKRFGLGYAANDSHKLHYYMRGLGYSDEELLKAALITSYNGGAPYDKFRNRVMFPVFDEQRRVIAFGGRILSDEKKAPKYLNSDETPVFQKRNILFALNYAKKSKLDYYIICEGYMDVIAMHQAGFDSAVASLGTAITLEQAQLLSKRGKLKVVLSYDSDNAGQKATSKAIGYFMQTKMEKVSVMRIKGAKDPDEFIKKYGAEAFKMLIEDSVGAVAFEMERLSAGLDMNNPDDKNTFIRRAIRFMSEIEDKAFRELCVEKAAALGDISKNTVMDGVNEIVSRKGVYSNSYSRSVPSLQQNYPDYDYDQRQYGGRDTLGFQGIENAENAVLSYLFHNPEEVGKVREQLLDGLVTEFGDGAFGFLCGEIEENREESEISRLLGKLYEKLREKFPEEMGRITNIVNDTVFAYSKDCFLEAAGKLSEIKQSSKSVNTFAELGEYIRSKQKKGE